LVCESLAAARYSKKGGLLSSRTKAIVVSSAAA
jgi:hypothetical protein